MLGGSTQLQFNGTYYEGDLSGITAGNIPFWFQHFYKPGNRISKESNWTTKLEEIVKKAPEWDIGVLTGVPAWIQILLEKIIETYNLNTIPLTALERIEILKDGGSAIYGRWPCPAPARRFDNPGATVSPNWTPRSAGIPIGAPIRICP